MAHAHFRNQQLEQGKRRGKTLVVGWPVWKDGGMGIDDPEATKMYLTSSGQRFLETGEGLALFDQILAQNNVQHDLGRPPNGIRRFLGLAKEPPAAANFAIKKPSNGQRIQGRGRRPEMKGFSIEQCLEWDLKQFINRLLKIPRDRIDRSKNLAEFGFNSIGLTQLGSN